MSDFNFINKEKIGIQNYDLIANNFKVKLVTIKKDSIFLEVSLKNILTYSEIQNVSKTLEKELSAVFSSYKIVVEITFDKSIINDTNYKKIANEILLEVLERHKVSKSLKAFEIVKNNSYLIKLQKAVDADDIIKYLPELQQELLNLGLDSKIDVFRESIQETEINNQVKTKLKESDGKLTPIKGIPHILPPGEKVPCKIAGKIFEYEFKEVKKGESIVLLFKITDKEDAITVKKYFTKAQKADLYRDTIKDGNNVIVFGKCEYDAYMKDVVVNLDRVEEIIVPELEREDSAELKRVELHTHTKMSTMDAVTSASDYIKLAAKLGHKAIAITDHDGLYAFPETFYAAKKNNIKPIFGLEVSLFDEETKITESNSDISLSEAEYVIFDIETTGFSVNYDQIIEIGAVKIKGQTISAEKFQKFIKLDRPLPSVITELTGITDEMLIGADSLDTVIKEFKDWIGDAILVAHNADFDISHIKEAYSNLGLGKISNSVIDTLKLSRVLYSEKLKYFNLKSICKYFKIPLENHHRAVNDAMATAEAFLYMLKDLYTVHNLNNYNEINSLIIKDVHSKTLNFPSHVTLLAKNQDGLKDLFKLVSIASTKYISGQTPMLSKQIISEYRENLLIGSSCANGEVWEKALNKSLDELKSAIEFYDYLEVQPVEVYNHLRSNFYDENDFISKIRTTIEKIVAIGTELNKKVVATGDVHYLNQEDSIYREVYTVVPSLGGGLHPLSKKNITVLPKQHFRTTVEMLRDFQFLGEEVAHKIVVDNTNEIADLIENVVVIKDKLFTPSNDFMKDAGVEDVPSEVIKICEDNIKKIYGENPHPIVTDRIKKELDSIIKHGFAVVYYISHLLVKKSITDDYLVGSRGSVGSSFTATMLEISEVNPLPPHYICPKCFHFTVKREDIEENEELSEVQKTVQSVDSGYDLPNCNCPKCQTPMNKDGHDIPFETFLGFEGDKVPDIDLNFSGEYQPTAHDYCKELFGEEYVYRAGTISTVAEKTAFGFVKMFAEKKNKRFRRNYVEYLAKGCEGVKRTTGQHPGGIIVVPNYMDIYDITPIQFPANDINSSWNTTHFDFHSIHDNLLKLDILGHDDPTMLKFLFDITGINPSTVPLDDKEVYELFNSTKSLNVSESDINSKVGSFGVPEFGTAFVRKMLVETKPSTFAELVKISGLSHGTDVWNGNAQDLVKDETCAFKDVIGCRDDIMVYLIYQGLNPKDAFNIMEFVRKGKASKEPAKWKDYRELMQEKNVPNWYIESCEKIKYMFPKAHATAYVLMAIRIAWFKVHKPLSYYAAYFSKRATQFDIKPMLKGKEAIKDRIKQIQKASNDSNKKMSATESSLITVLEIALEMTARGYRFLNVDVEKSKATEFLVDTENNGLLLPFITIDGLGETVADKIVIEREEKSFENRDDFIKRSKVSKTVLALMNDIGVLENLPEVEEVTLFNF